MESKKPIVLNNDELQNHWKNIKLNIPKNKEHMVCFNHSITCLGENNGVMTQTQFLLYDGNGFGFGECDKDSKLKIFLVGYPCVDELTKEQICLIRDKHLIDITDEYEITIMDSFILFGKMKELLYVEQ